MKNWTLIVAWWSENESLTRGIYMFYHSIRKNKFRYESPFDFMGFQMVSKTPLYDEQYTLFAIAFLDNTLKCSPAQRLLLWIWALYSLEKISSNPYFREGIPYFLEVASNLKSLVSQFSWEEIHRISNKTFVNVDVLKLLTQFKADTFIK